jgi:xylan 1,4-beta-xylosidase
LKHLLLLLAACAAGTAHAADPVRFDWFEYTGRDTADDYRLPASHYRNPILAGYYPDPSVTRVGDKFYLVNSSFAHWPGIPIHESTDLVNWKLVGYALNDATKVNFDGLGTSRGVFAPSIHFHDGTYYVINTLVDAGGNFFVTAKDPHGPWSDPEWLKEIDGIDPSFFFDDDGKTFILNNGPPESAPLYNGHRAIWIQEFDLANRRLTGPRKVIVNGGVDLASKPIWIEGPHLYRIRGTYYLMCAEGGTEAGHSEVIFRAKSPWGPFEPYKRNPILTQRDLPKDRDHAVSSAGHADLVQRQDGTWWAVFLATRPYSGERFNTGRETFLLPVTWKDGWPTILPPHTPIPLLVHTRVGKVTDYVRREGRQGARIQRDEFKGPSETEWLQVRVPKQAWYRMDQGALEITALPVNLDQKLNPSFLARRQQDQRFDASTQFAARLAPGISAGIAVYQNEDHWFFLGTKSQGSQRLFLERRAGTTTEVIAEASMAAPPEILRLRVSADGQNYSFYYDAGRGWQPLKENADGSILSTEIAGGFVGTVLGPFARQENP